MNFVLQFRRSKTKYYRNQRVNEDLSWHEYNLHSTKPLCEQYQGGCVKWMQFMLKTYRIWLLVSNSVAMGEFYPQHVKIHGVCT